MSNKKPTEGRPVVHGRMVVVKFKEGTRVRLRRNKLSSNVPKEVEGVQEVLDKFPGIKVGRLFTRSEKDLEADRKAAQKKTEKPLADLNLFYRLDLTGEQDAMALVEALNELPNVEMAYIEPEYIVASEVPPDVTEGMSPIPTTCLPGPMRAICPPGPPPGPICPPAPTICYYPTPDLSAYQDYLKPAPTGIDAFYAWNRTGGKGQNVKFADIEKGWNLSHEDLTSAAGAAVYGTNTGNDHGTKVLGEVIAVHNSRGVNGIAPDAAVGVLCSADGHSVADCINHAASVLSAGDVILIELQIVFGNSPGNSYMPVEIVEGVYVAIEAAVASGVIVVEAAANGAWDLDAYERPLWLGGGGFVLRRSVRDSGAIMVGAGCPPSGTFGPDRSRWQWSNYGSRLDLQGQGREVCTTGDGALYDCGPNRRYDDDFSNTSAASPQVVGAALALQGISKAKSGSVLTPAQIRQVLVDTGTPQQDGFYGPATQQIGPRPNLRGAIDQLWPTLHCWVGPDAPPCWIGPYVQCLPGPIHCTAGPDAPLLCAVGPYNRYITHCGAGPDSPYVPDPYQFQRSTPWFMQYPPVGVSQRRWRWMQAHWNPYYGYQWPQQAGGILEQYGYPGYGAAYAYGYPQNYGYYGYGSGCCSPGSSSSQGQAADPAPEGEFEPEIEKEDKD